jgi:hypothetical protein
MNFEKLDAILKKIVDGSPVSMNRIGGKDVRNEVDALRKFGYITLDDVMGQECTITPAGMKFHLEGGFKGFTDKDKRTKEDAELRINLNGWYYRTKWLAPTLSISSIVISLVSAIVAVLVYIYK